MISALQVRQLPFEAPTAKLQSEWNTRAAMFQKFEAYLSAMNASAILEIGCGNGWYSGRLSESITKHEYCGLDVNLTELKLAAKAFTSQNIKWLLADVFNEEMNALRFNLIFLPASIQYFPDLSELIRRLNQLLVEQGEIHIIDSPLYDLQAVKAAKERSSAYYKQMQSDSLIEHYHHHSTDTLSKHYATMLFDPHSLKSKSLRKLGIAQPHFAWYRIQGRQSKNS